MKKLFTFWSMALMVLALGFSQKAHADWYVAGEPASAFNGLEWKESAEVNKMTLQDDGTYKYESFNFEVKQETIAFKVTNGTWNEAYPGDNYVISLETTGFYDLVITFNPETKEVNGTATLKEATQVEDEYIVCGDPILFGSDWDKSDTNNKLIKQYDENNNVIYCKTFSDVELPMGLIKYKFILNGSWTALNKNDRELYISAPGVYDVTFTWRPALNDGDAMPIAKSQEEFVPDYMSLTGPLFGGWPDTNEEGIWQNNYVDMEVSAGANNVWTYTLTGFEATEASYSYKVAANHKWGIFELPSQGDETWTPEEGPGIYTIVFTATIDGENSSLTAVGSKTGDIVIDIPALYIIGEANDNGWFANVGLAMTKTGDATFEAEEVTFKGANEGYSYFGFAKQLMNEAEDWDNLAQYRIGAVAEGAFLVTDEYLDTELALAAGQVSFQIPAGIYTLKADLAAMKLVITKTGEYSDNPNAIEQVENSAIATVWYNLQGQRVVAPVKGVYIHNGRKVVVK